MLWSLETSWNGMTASISWHPSLSASMSQVQPVLEEQCACHCELAGLFYMCL